MQDQRTYDETARPTTAPPGARTRGGARSRKKPSGDNLKYEEWHRSLGSGVPVHDVDQIEWRDIGGAFLPVAVIELTAYDAPLRMQDVFLAHVLRRFEAETSQANMTRYVASCLGVYAWVVAYYRADLSEFHIYNLSEKRGWWTLNRDRYESWLRCLDRPVGACVAVPGQTII